MELEDVAMYISENFSYIENGTDLETSQNCPTNNLSLVYTVVQVFCAIIFIIGIIGNTIVIYVVLRYSKMRTITNMYILNLAIADELSLIGIPFLIITMSSGVWPFGYFFCKVYMIFAVVTQYTSSIFLCIMSADRYIAICRPIAASKLRTPLISRVISLSAWIASALVMTPIFMYTTIIMSYEGPSCNIVLPEHKFINAHTLFILYSFMLGFTAPLTLIFTFYYLVFHKLKTVGLKFTSEEDKRTHTKVTKLVFIIIAVYVFCYLPYWVCQLSQVYMSPSECINEEVVTIFFVASCLSYSNSAINPFLYAFLSDNFRKSFIKACTCIFGKDFKRDRDARTLAHDAETSGRFIDAKESQSEAHTMLTSKSITSEAVTSEVHPLQ